MAAISYARAVSGVFAMRCPRLALLLILALPFYASAQEAAPPVLHKVEGLELTPNIITTPGKLVIVEAKCAGVVRFELLPNGDFEPSAITEEKRVILAPPPAGQAILILAVGVIDGAPTRFARCYVVSGEVGPSEDNPGKKPRPPPKPKPEPGPTPKPLPAGKLHVTLVLDYATLSPAAAILANSPTLRKALTDAGHNLHVLAVTAPEVTARQLTRFVQQAGGSPAVIVQDAGGKVLQTLKLPATEAELLSLFRK